jgi:acetylornithine/succinyldiaminopimelate/putrescine aminotransferase/predicted amino acid dehydrogenase
MKPESFQGAQSSLNPPLRRLLTLLRMERTWARAEGVWLVDSDGRRFLDCYAQYGVMALGHNAPCVVQAVQSALKDAEPALVQPYRAPHAEALARRLCELAPGHLSRGLFVTSGAEAVEAAIKLVRSASGRPVILSATGSFHGKTLGALAATGQRKHAEGFGPEPPGFEYVEFGDAAALESRLRRDGNRIAAFFLEPIQGERGVHLPPPGYLQRVRELCSRHGVALVLDEIQTGLGRTGRLFACEHEGVAPDVLLVGKALGGGLFPLSGCFASAEFWDERFALSHSSTFANNNIACRAGVAVLEALTQGGICVDAERLGRLLMERLQRLAMDYPGVVAAVRGRGLMSAIELRTPSAENGSLLSFLAHQGLYAYAVAAVVADNASVLVLPTLGETPVIRIAPPLIITEPELATALDGIEAVCRALQRDATGTVLKSIGALDGYPPDLCVQRSAPAPLLPVRQSARAKAPAYAFLVHYTCLEDLAITNPSLRHLDRKELERVCDYTSVFAPGVLMRAPTIHSATGAAVEGIIIGLPLLPAEMARRGLRSVSGEIARAVDLAASLGVKIVGLGGHTAPYSRRGLAVTGRGPAITTGNALTAGMAMAAVREAARARNLRLSDARVAVVGARGSVGSLCARLVARERPKSLVLVGNPGRGAAALESLGRTLPPETRNLEITTDSAALWDCDIVITATSAARPVIGNALIAPGTIVCDVARPPDTSALLRSRGDLTVIDGGRVALPDPSVRFGAGNLNDLPDGVVLACLAETMLLALEGEARDTGVGYDVAVAEADRLLALARLHGFRLAPLPAPPRTRRATCRPVRLADFIHPAEGVLHVD